VEELAATMPPKAAKSKEPVAERPILGRFSSHLKIGIVCLLCLSLFLVKCFRGFGTSFGSECTRFLKQDVSCTVFYQFPFGSVFIVHVREPP